MNEKNKRTSQRLLCLVSSLLVGQTAAGIWLVPRAFTQTRELSSPSSPSSRPPRSVTGYHVIGRYNVGGSGQWDYIAIDSDARRLYVTHETEVDVLDADSGKVVGRIADTPGVHGVAIDSELHRGFTSNGRDMTVTIFDTQSLNRVKTVQLRSAPDFILYDPFSKRVFPLNKRTQVLDAETGSEVKTLDLGGDPEAAVSDGKGRVYVNLNDKEAVAVIDSNLLSVIKIFPVDHCAKPHSLSYDAAYERLFLGCGDGLRVVDANTGKTVGGGMMCAGVDAGGFDPEGRLIFESCYEGVVSIIRETRPSSYELIETVPTQLWAGTMVFDPRTKNIYLPTAEYETLPDGESRTTSRRRIKDGSFVVLVLGKF